MLRAIIGARLNILSAGRRFLSAATPPEEEPARLTMSIREFREKVRERTGNSFSAAEYKQAVLQFKRDSPTPVDDVVKWLEDMRSAKNEEITMLRSRMTSGPVESDSCVGNESVDELRKRIGVFSMEECKKALELFDHKSPTRMDDAFMWLKEVQRTTCEEARINKLSSAKQSDLPGEIDGGEEAVKESSSETESNALDKLLKDTRHSFSRKECKMALEQFDHTTPKRLENAIKWLKNMHRVKREEKRKERLENPEKFYSQQKSVLEGAKVDREMGLVREQSNETNSVARGDGAREPPKLFKKVLVEARERTGNSYSLKEYKRALAISRRNVDRAVKWLDDMRRTENEEITKEGGQIEEVEGKKTPKKLRSRRKSNVVVKMDGDLGAVKEDEKKFAEGEHNQLTVAELSRSTGGSFSRKECKMALEHTSILDEAVIRLKGMRRAKWEEQKKAGYEKSPKLRSHQKRRSVNVKMDGGAGAVEELSNETESVTEAAQLVPPRFDTDAFNELSTGNRKNALSDDADKQLLFQTPGWMCIKIDGGVGTVVELSCETDSTAKGKPFQQLLNSLSNAAMSHAKQQKWPARGKLMEKKELAIDLLRDESGKSMRSVFKDSIALIGETVKVKSIHMYKTYESSVFDGSSPSKYAQALWQTAQTEGLRRPVGGAPSARSGEKKWKKFGRSRH